MPSPRLPEITPEYIESLARDPSIVTRLPYPQQVAVLEQLQQLNQQLGGSANVPATPIEMAVKTPRYQWMDAPHLHYLGDEIARAVSVSKDDGLPSALLVTMPPRHAKSFTCSVWTPFWFLAQYPEDGIIMVCSDAQNARKWGGKVRRLIELYGEQYGLRLNPKKVAADDWELTTGGGMKCFGWTGGISGNPAKLLIADDLVSKSEQAESAYQRDQLWTWWDETFMQRVEDDTTVIVIGTRYHEDDVLGRALAHSENGDGLHFEHISLAAKAIDEDDPIGRTPGEGLWLKRFRQDFYDLKERTSSPKAWHSIHQQTPTAPGGNMVDPNWWGWYYPHQLPQQFDGGVQSWDIALDAEKKEDSQHAGIVSMRKGAVVYLRDGFAEHCDINKVIAVMKAWNSIHREARAKLIERATAGVTLTQTMRWAIPGVMAWPPKGKQKGSKEACLDAIIPAIRSGNVLLPLNPNGTKPDWAAKLVLQHQQFPRGKYDDFVDATTQGVSYLLPGTRAFERDQQAEAERLAQQQDLDPAGRHTANLHAVLKKMSEPAIKALQQRTLAQDRAILPFMRRMQALSRGGGRSFSMRMGRGTM